MKKVMILFFIIIFVNFIAADDASLSPSVNSDVSIIVDANAPIINIITPQNASYGNSTPLQINYTIIDVSLDSTWYSLNSQPNITITEPFTLNLAEGEYHLVIYANDSFSRMNFSEVSFYMNASLGPVCGDSTCDANEDCSSCPGDCGICPYCGDGSCNSGESCSNCETDCGECPTDDEEEDEDSGDTGSDFTPNFNVDISELKISLNPGQSLTKTVKVSNTGETILRFTVELPTGLTEFITTNVNAFNLAPKQNKTINIIFNSKTTDIPNIHTGNILIKAGTIERTIFTTIEIESKDTLFDVIVTIPPEYLIIKQGQDLEARIKIIDVGDVGEVDVLINKAIKDDENNIIFEKEEIITVNQELNLIETINLSKDIKPGTYVFYSTITYDGKIAISSQSFDIKSKYNWKLILLIAVITLIILAMILIIYKMRKKTPKRKKIKKLKTKKSRKK